MLLALPLLAAAARADVLHVPGDFATLTDAVAALQPGDEIVLAAGSYDGPFVIASKQDFVLRGQCKALLTGGTDVLPTLKVSGCSNVRIEHLSFADAPGVAVELSTSDGVTARRLNIAGAVERGLIANVTTDLLIDRCRVDGPTNVGILVAETSVGLVSRCIVTGTILAGVRIQNCASVTVDRCHVEDAPGAGVDLLDDVACIVRRNVLQPEGDAGIRVSGIDNAVLENRVQGVGGPGVLLMSNATSTLVEGNKLLSCASGITALGTASVLRDDQVVKPGLVGVLCTGEGSILDGLRILKPGTDGFSFDATASGGMVLDCKALAPGDDGFEIAGGELLLHGNLAQGAGFAGFHVTGDSNTLVDNTAHGSGSFDLDDSGADNHFVDNDFGSTAP